jgi:hypothetical protein
LEYLNSFLLGPCALFKLFVDVDFLFPVGVGCIGVVGVEAFAVVDQVGADIDLFLVLIDSSSLFGFFLFLDFLFGIVLLVGLFGWFFFLFLIGSSCLFPQLLFFPFCLFDLPLLSFLFLDVGGPVDPVDLLLFVGVLINLLFELFFHFDYLFPKFIDFFLEGFAVFLQRVDIGVFRLEVSDSFHGLDKGGVVFLNAIDFELDFVFGVEEVGGLGFQFL